jgi:sulfur carrier protein
MIVLNGESAPFRAGETLDAVLASLDLTTTSPGVAIAVDREVVPRAEWETFTLADGACVEVLTAMQGG